MQETPLDDKAANDEVRRRIRKHMQRRTTELKTRVEGSIRPFVVADENGDAGVIGSCVLLRVRDRIFAISAKHVFDDAKGYRMYVGVEPAFVEIQNEIFHFAVDRDNTAVPVDIGFTDITNAVGLPPDTAGILSASDSDPNDVCSEQNFYIGFGFPATRVTTDFRKNHVAASGLSTLGKGRPEHCAPLGFTRFTHLAMEFSIGKMRTEDIVQRAPDPHGMSGGALFRFDSLKSLHDSDVVPDDKLVGILIRYHRNRSVIVSANIVFALEAIRCWRPELTEYIPRSKTVALNIRQA